MSLRRDAAHAARTCLGITALVALIALTPWSPGQALADDPLCVAVIEQRRGDRVAVREVLTREHLTELMDERRSGRLLGDDARESEGRVLFGGVEVGTEGSEEEEPDRDEELHRSFFDESLSRMLAEEGRDLSVAETKT